MKQYFYLTIIFSLTLVGCKTEKAVIGTYKSNYQEQLTLNRDKTFTIEYDRVDAKTSDYQVKLTGQWTLKNKTVSLVVDDKKYKTWECWGFKIKRNKLKAPADCEATNRFILFTKTTK